MFVKINLLHIKFHYRRKIKIKHARRDEKREDKTFKVSKWKMFRSKKGEETLVSNTSSSNCLFWWRKTKFFSCNQVDWTFNITALTFIVWVKYIYRKSSRNKIYENHFIWKNKSNYKSNSCRGDIIFHFDATISILCFERDKR